MSLALAAPTSPRPPAPAPVDFATESRTIVVTGARTEQAIGDSAVATQVIRRDAIEASGAENLAELLEEHPGLQVLRSFGGAGGAGVSMQGLDPKYTLILVDGQRATGRINGALDLSRFPAEDIEQVEIVKGPGSALYGSDAIAGVINIITRKTRGAREAEAHASFGSFDTQDLSGRAGLRRGRWGAGLAAGWHQTRGFDRDPGDVATTGNFQSILNVSQWTELRARPDLRITATADGQQRDLRGVDLSATGAVFDRRNLTRTTSLTLAPEITWSAPARLRLTGHLAYFDDRYSLDQRASDDLDEVQRTRDLLGQVTAQYDHLVAGKHLFTAGIEGQFEGLSTPRLGEGRAARQRFALFVQDEWRVLPGRVVLVPGGRFDLDSQFGAYATPRLAVRVDPDPGLTLRASAGLGYRAPSFRELLLPLTACLPAEDAEDGAEDDGGIVDDGIQTAAQGDGSHITVVDARDETTWRRLDFESGAEVSEDSPAWDLGFLRFNVATRVAVASLAGADFDALTVAPVAGYRSDADASDPADKQTMPGYALDLWYDYDPATHVLTARDVVHVVRSAEDHYFKVQMQDYYDDAGTSGYVSLRWAPIAPPN